MNRAVAADFFHDKIFRVEPDVSERQIGRQGRHTKKVQYLGVQGDNIAVELIGILSA
jgi:hypothetical protein